MKSHCLVEVLAAWGASLALSTAGQAAPGEDKIAPIAAADFDRLLAEIKPRRGESPWREIAWLTDITEARRRSAAEDRPLVIFTAADGSPLGRT